MTKCFMNEINIKLIYSYENSNGYILNIDMKVSKEIIKTCEHRSQ